MAQQRRNETDSGIDLGAIGVQDTENNASREEPISDNPHETVNSNDSPPQPEVETATEEQEQPINGNNEENNRNEAPPQNRFSTFWQTTRRHFNSALDAVEGKLGMKRLCPYCFREVSRRHTRRVNIQIGRHVRHERATSNNPSQVSIEIPICSHCGNDIPADYFKNSSKHISVIGGFASGKSTYMTILIELLLNHKSLISELGLHCGIANESGKDLFKKYRSILIDSQNKIGGTNELHPPIILRINSNNHGKTKSLFISFFDTPGEEFRSIEGIFARHPHIFNAQALLFLMNPLDIRGVFNILQDEDTQGIYTIFRENDDVYEIAQNLHDVFVINRKIKSMQRLNIPIAFCFSRADEIEDISNLYLPEDYEEEYIDLQDLKTEVTFSSEDLYEFLQDTDPRLVNIISQNFSNFQLFPVSPMGSRLTSDADSAKYLGFNPKGVLNPMLWILSELKFLQ